MKHISIEEQHRRERLVALTLQMAQSGLQQALAQNGGSLPEGYEFSIEPRVVVEHLAKLEEDAQSWRTLCKDPDWRAL